MKKNLIVAALQPQPTHDDYFGARERVSALVKKLGEIDVILLPEYWDGLYDLSMVKEHRAGSLEFLGNMAKDKNAFVIAAALAEENGKTYNRCFIIDPQGNLLQTYDKRRPFGHEIPGGICPGKGEVVFDLHGWTAGVKICSDLWHGKDFQEFLSHDPDILFVPVKAVVAGEDLTDYGRESWYSLGHTRAKEGCIILCIADSGRGLLSGTYHASGSSCIIDPSVRYSNKEKLHQTVYSLADNLTEGIALKQVDLEKIRMYRSYRREAGLLPYPQDLR